MDKPEVDINIEDIYYKQDEDILSKKLLGNSVTDHSYCCYNFIECFFACFL